MTVQVPPEHYDFHRYDTLERWGSYWYQLRAALRGQPRSVLEIGSGTRVFRSYLENCGVEVRSVDIDDTRRPDYVADVSDLDGTLPPGLRFDCVAAFQVLEHLPYDRFEACLAGLARRAAPVCLLSLPYHGVQFRLAGSFAGLRFSRGISIPFPWAYRFNGEHHWELGWQHPIRSVTHTIAKYFDVIERGFIPENPYHYLWVLHSRVDLSLRTASE